ncbi:L-threonine 3-dehydrogenase, partial [Coxiella burnetii]
MKVLSKLKPAPGLWLHKAPTPKPGRDEVLIKIKKTAICGTDLHIYKWDEWAQKTIPVPMHVGHEFVGEIVEVGEAASALAVGDRVSGEGHITCGDCRNCRAGKRHLCRYTVGVGVNRPGAFAEYLVIPAKNAYKIPAKISDDIAAILDPFGNAAHSALEFDLVGEDVLITGAGPVGLMSAAIARHVGARHVVITDVNDYRLALAEKVGGTAAVNSTKTPLTETIENLG